MPQVASNRLLKLICLLLLALVTGDARAQLGDSKANAAIDKAIMQLFGKSSFTSQAEVSIKGAQNISMDVEFAVLDGQTCSTIDLGAIRSASIPASALAQLKAAGLDKIASVTRQDSASVLMIYPSAKSYVEFTPPGAKAPSAIEAKLTITDIGKEKINGQDCTKQKVLITDDKGATSEVLAWINDKKQPVQLQAALEGTTVTMLFKAIQDKKPDVSLFKAPTGFTKYESPQALMMARMMEAMKAPK
jgi:hypothetical protein